MQVLRIARPDQCCFRATHQGAELDLLMFPGLHRFRLADRTEAVPLWALLPSWFGQAGPAQQ